MSDVKFVRIRGRIVPIKKKSGNSGMRSVAPKAVRKDSEFVKTVKFVAKSALFTGILSVAILGHHRARFVSNMAKRLAKSNAQQRSMIARLSEYGHYAKQANKSSSVLDNQIVKLRNKNRTL